MSSPTVQAKCPGCQNALRIPRELLGKPVKCKKCGTVVRTKARPEDESARHAAMAAGAGVPVPMPAEPSYGAPPQGYPQAVPQPYYAPPHAAQPGYGYGPPPGYAYPAAVAPGPNPLAVELPASAATKAYKGRGRYKRGGSTAGKYLWIAFGLFMIAGLAAAGVYVPGYIKKLRQESGVAGTNGETAQKPAAVTQPAAAVLGNLGPIPRRMLFVQINNYLYLNPLTSAAQGGNGYGPDRTRGVAQRLAHEWRVPKDKDNNQLYILSDNGPPADVRAPYKNVLVETFQKFFDSSRAQDRIFVYFGGHAFEKDGKAYLVPIEGDPDEVESLLPLDDFYARLAACPAQQKVMVWDVCRFNPQRGKSRKGSEPMTAELEQKLAAAPAGVQTILTSSVGQNGLEFFSQQMAGETPDYTITGSSFLAAAHYVANKTRNVAKGVSPSDPLPIQPWVEAVSKRVEDVAKSSLPGEDKKPVSQTPKLVGAPVAEPLAYNPEEAPPKRFELPQPPKGAAPELVAAIRGEIKLPSLLKSDAGDDGLDSFPFPADKLAEYKSDVPDAQILADKEKYKFEWTVLDAFATIRKVWSGEANADAGAKTEIRRVFEGETSEAAKKTIKDDQIYPAIAILNLEEIVQKLDKLAPDREKQSKRWQANYDYAMAQAKARLAFMNEYNLLLGQIFTPEVLPVLDREKAGHTGWALASSEKMKSKKDVKALVEDSQELYAKIIETYKGTPWEIQAKRDKGIALGLEWQPYTPGGKTME